MVLRCGLVTLQVKLAKLQQPFVKLVKQSSITAWWDCQSSLLESCNMPFVRPTSGAFAAGPYTGGAANPARVLGSAIVFNSKWGDVSQASALKCPHAQAASCGHCTCSQRAVSDLILQWNLLLCSPSKKCCQQAWVYVLAQLAGGLLSAAFSFPLYGLGADWARLWDRSSLRPHIHRRHHSRGTGSKSLEIATPKEPTLEVSPHRCITSLAQPCQTHLDRVSSDCLGKPVCAGHIDRL